MSRIPPPKSRPLPSGPPEAWGPLLRLARLAAGPFERFLRIEAASGIVLIMVTAVALAWANSPWSASYAQLWHTPLGIRVGTFAFERPLEWFVNDGLMVVFFFVVGLEIRCELYHGELSDWRRAALPGAAALGGMLVPAALYLVLAGTTATRSGWGVPMATDIAFAVGILTLLGRRVPAALRVLLLALAIIDDLGAIIVIAIFYSSGLAYSGLFVAAAGIGGIAVMQRFGVRTKLAYVAPSLLVWAGMYAAGIHPTIAGVIVGMMTPVRVWLDPQGLLVGVRQDLERLAQSGTETLSSHELADTLRHVDVARREAVSPADGLIERLHPWVAFGIMPVFALANAGVSLTGEPLNANSWRVVTAVTVGLVVGKPVGVFLASWVALRLGIAALPAGTTLRHLVVLGVVAGVGFTMALFIAQLAFADANLLAAAKKGVLVASGVAAIFGLILGRLLLSPGEISATAPTAAEQPRLEAGTHT
jgi:Na+:H+ antiporter, NhaA family